MNDFDYFRAIQNATGSNSIQDVLIAEAKRDFETGFYSSIGIKRNIKISDRIQDFIITPTKESDVYKIISLLELSFNIGEVLEYEGDTWLVVEKDVPNGIYSRGDIQRCNYLLRWQNPETFKIIERWCIAKDPYSGGEDKTSVVTTGSGKYKIKLPCDHETRLLKRDRRFLIDWSGGERVAYRIVRFDGITNTLSNNSDGFIVVNVDEDELRTGIDRVDLGIADYIDPPENSVESSGNVVISFSGRPELRVGGNNKSFTVSFYDNAENKIESIVPEWEVITESDLRNQIETIVVSDDSINLKFWGSEDSIGKKFRLKVSASDQTHGYFESIIDIELIALF
jgi:hypothetical protein